MTDQNFSAEQQSYLQGFVLGADVARKVQGLPVLSNSANPTGELLSIGGETAPPREETAFQGPELIHQTAQDEQVANGGKLCKEEVAKREKNPLDMWDQMRAAAASGEFPKGTDVFLWKFHGLFHTAPNQDAFMCRMRFPGGVIKSWQLRELARLAEHHAGGYVDVTTRANLQFREIPATEPIHILLGLRDAGVINIGAGGDNIRNCTSSPLSGIDPDELIETYPLAKEMHHHIIQHRELYGLPRKFNIAFDGGGRISALESTNDIGFSAVDVTEENATADVTPGIWFMLGLGGITGHKDFARPTGVLLKPEECVDVAAAIVKVFVHSGDRTNRNTARLKYVLDDWGFEKFLTAVEEEMGTTLRRFPLDNVPPRRPVEKHGHIGFHDQQQKGKVYVGVVLPVGRIMVEQMHGLAAIAEKYGSGDMRMTVWQNVIIPDIDKSKMRSVKKAIEELGLHWDASSFRSGLVACTGNAGCKYAAADTKGHAMQLASYLEDRLDIDQPINIHLTGCHHSCAQHYIGDIGLKGTAVEVGEEMVEGYEVVIGGGYDHEEGIGRDLFTAAFDEIPPKLLGLVSAYLDDRTSPDETFVEFTRRHEIEQLRAYTETAVAVS